MAIRLRNGISIFVSSDNFAAIIYSGCSIDQTVCESSP
jgi:hypothetical protein